MSIDLKSIVKQYVAIDADNTSAVVMLEQVQDGEWELARKSEYKRDVFSIPEETVFLEVCFSRSGNYHSGYTYTKPTFNLVEKTTTQVVSYPPIVSLKQKANDLKDVHFDKNDDTTLEPIYASGWVREEKVHTYESVYELGEVLFKQTLYGNSDWTEFVEYDIVDKFEETAISYNKI